MSPEYQTLFSLFLYYKNVVLKNKKNFKEIQNKIYFNDLNSELIIKLFGSYVKNLETKKSYVDVYINSNSKKDKKLIEELSEDINITQGKFDKK